MNNYNVLDYFKRQNFFFLINRLNIEPNNEGYQKLFYS